MPLVAKQGGEARRRIEPGEAKPVHRTVATDKRGGLHVAYQAVVLDTHQADSP